MKRIIAATLLVLLFSVNASTQAQDLAAVDVALDHVRDNAEALGLTPTDVASLRVSDANTSRHNGITHVYLIQQYQGIDVYNAILNVNVQGGRVFSLGNRFVPDLANRLTGTVAALTAEAAVDAAAGHLGLMITEPVTTIETRPGPAQEVRLSRGGVSLEPIRSRLVYQPLEDGTVRLAREVTIYTLDAQNWWNVRVDAASGAELDRNDWVVQDVWGEPMPTTGRHAEETASKTLLPDSYRVFPLPIESPNHGPRSLEADPADPTASPFGWHDTDGAAGAEFTTTQGNNAHAYTDTDANNLPDAGSSPDGGPTLVFDFPLDLNMGPETYQDAVVTNLFYWNNAVHDVLYQYGFDEASGNFQQNNYGNGGLGTDFVFAEAQDGSGVNNANFGTPPDGFNPRMQMFRWTNPFPNQLVVGAPVNDTYTMSGANFGPAFTQTGVTGTLVLADDGTATTSDGCEALVNGGDISGNIALIDRGSCTFVTKVLNAQAVGATAVVIVNNTGGSPITMGGTDPTITIPSGMIAMADGDVIKAALPGVSATAQNAGSGAVDRDSDLDAGVIAHEYGHGVSNRLTGGPGNVGCLSHAEQAGEGWSDYIGLLLTMPGPSGGPDARGVGTYLLFEPTTGNGIRPAPYSPNFGVNGFTYSDMSGVSVPHGIGFIFNSAMWDMTWLFIDRYGFDEDLYAGSGGNNRALQRVLDGMKLQPCSPGFIDSRNAILLADEALSTPVGDGDPLTPDGDNADIIWQAFADRGFGFSASQGSQFTVGDETAAFDLPPGLPDDVEIAGRVRLEDGATAVEAATLDLTGDETQQTASSGDGTYALTVGSGGAYTVTPSKSDDPVGPANGVNVLDIALVRQDILNQAALPSPYAIIAADVDASGAVNVLDVLSVRQLVLSQITAFPAGLWRFVSAAYVFSDPTDPLAESFAEARSYTNLTSSQADENFVAVRLGDVNGDWSPGTTALKRQEVAAVVSLDVGEAVSISSEAVEVPVRAVSGFDQVGGLQLTLEWSAEQLEFGEVVAYGLPGMGPEHVGLAGVASGYLTLAWDDATLSGVTLSPGAEVLRVRFERRGVGSGGVRITSGVTPVFAHRGGDLAVLAVEGGEGVTGRGVPTRFALVGNYPNPFNPATTVAVDLPEAASVRVRVYDVLGREVLMVEAGRVEAGSGRSVRVDGSSLASGVYVYRVEAEMASATRVATGRMTLVK